MLSEYRPEFMHRHGVVVLEHSDETVTLGRWKTLPDQVRRSLESFHGKRIVTRVVDPDDPAIQLVMRSSSAALSGTYGDENSAGMRHRTRNLPPGERLLRTILLHARDVEATDLSLWRVGPFKWCCSLRRRGALMDPVPLDDRAAQTVIRLLKLNAGLDVMQRRVPQDGRVEFPWLPGVSMRVATVGDGRDEALAVRFLDRTPPPIGHLGFGSLQLVQILRALAKRTGLILCCGPTGSGKTTTAAAMATLISRGRRKVVSVEDPVEYRLPGVLQIEMTDTGEDVLAAALRQDPDAIWIGEVRRRAHVVPVGEALLSGHLVLTTVHAAGPEQAVYRLIDLGLAREIISENLLLTCTQNLCGDPTRLVCNISTAGGLSA